ncbi:hypothetical protein I4U23_012972 [Adineta vaga]|nr:hypothetical protein I4U23_012972 [Adineta vaga]
MMNPMEQIPNESNPSCRKLTKGEYSPVRSTRKINLLLQRSFRYSYRKRCCKCCPTILCELLFPIILIALLVLTHWSVSYLETKGNPTLNGVSELVNRQPCSQNVNPPTTLSNDLFTKCFQFPSVYRGNRWNSYELNRNPDTVNLVFHPMTNETKELVKRTKKRFQDMNCNNINVWSENINRENISRLLQGEKHNLIIIDFFDSTNDLKKKRNIAYNIITERPHKMPRNEPIDMSFKSFSHPTRVADRFDELNRGSNFPVFADVKIFIDSLLIGFQTNVKIEYEIEKTPMICTSIRSNILSEGEFLGFMKFLIDFIFLIPYIMLLTNLIQEKNAKVKEILKVLGIQSILNNFAHAIRTLIILGILILLLCFALKQQPYGYFLNVNFGFLFLSYFIYSLQLISFCILIAQLFDRNVRAELTIFFIYVLSSSIYSNVIYWPKGIQYLLIFLIPHFAQYSLFQQAVLNEFAKRDISLFQEIYRGVPSYFCVLIIMMFSCAFYWLLSWYFEKIYPGEYGIPLDWNFLFQRNYWQAEKRNHFTPASLNRDEFLLSRRNSNGTAIVHVNNLVKKFGPDKIAVHNVSFDLYENQITSLLGPNGSGKTTIFNCLIGIYKQTSGTITIENDEGVNCDTRTNMEMLRKSIGYCPQHDILFDLLTIKEQLEFYAVARGFEKNKEKIANEMLHIMDLYRSKDLYCKALSGGMKRRLSLACAFIGDTKVILLDEPSSGLDPSNRRLLWDWLRTMKEGKTLLLTTHFMEESDALSDRIMIISDGHIKVDGTSTKLKEDYGLGYKLIINKQNNFSTNYIMNSLRHYLPKLTIETDIFDGDVIFRTNQQPTEQFVQALHQLETMKKENQIKNYGVQNSTMDDVFLKITSNTNIENESESIPINTETIEQQCRRVFDNQHISTGIRYYLHQYYGLLIKTLRVRSRRWVLTLIILLIPILYHLLTNMTLKDRNKAGIFQMNVNLLNPQTILYHSDSIMEKYFRASINGAKLEQTQIGNLSQMNEDILRRRIDRPYTYTDIYLGIKILKPIVRNKYKIQVLSSNLISGYEILSLASNIFYKYALNDTDASIQTTLIFQKTENFTTELNLDTKLNYLSIFSCHLKFLPITLFVDIVMFYILFFYVSVFLISERRDSFLSLINISGLHPALYWIFTYLFDIVISIIWFSYLLAVFCIFYSTFNVVSREQSGMEKLFRTEFLNPWNLRIKFYPLTILIILPTLPFTYLLTKIFKNDINGGMLINLILVILHVISMITTTTIAFMKNSSIPKLVYWLCNIIFPSINAQIIITDILSKNNPTCQAYIFKLRKLFHNKMMENGAIEWNYLIFILHILVLLLLVIIIDSGLLKFSPSCTPNFDENTLDDDDVLAERSRLLELQTNVSNNANERMDYLTVHDLVKYYPRRKVLAVNHLTFGAKRGELFGLLGYNGAGKTTTFRIIIGDLISTQGTAYIRGQNVRGSLRSIRQLGYCPQENCNMDFLTVQDSLYLLARIRGVKMAYTKTIVETMSSLFLLDPFLNNYIHQLSGGTKRRLHAALALIGPPSVAILDEPTTGVDPNARQRMQEIFLNANKAKLTIILTSHSMDECERVCNRLGIMVRGQLACLGTIQHLKSKFGQGYTVEIKVRSTTGDSTETGIQKVERFLLSQRNYQIDVKETTHTTGLFQIRESTPAELFQLIEENKEQLNIETYTISQTTLEQIFLSFGKDIHTN